MQRNAFGDDDSDWSLPTTNVPLNRPEAPQNEQFPGQSLPQGAPGTSPSWNYQQPGGDQASTSPFGSRGDAPGGGFGADFGGSGGVPIGAPRAWLAGAAAAVVLGAVLGLAAGGKPALSVLGWL